MDDEISGMSFEEAMKRLERIVADLEAGTFSLADSLRKFEEGVALGKHCRELLDRADLRVRKHVEGPDGSPQDGSPREEDRE